MNITVAGKGEEYFLLAIFLAMWSLFVTIFFMVCAWRAMRAHQSIAQSMREAPKKELGTSPRATPEA